jgi:hypothetical protein
MRTETEVRERLTLMERALKEVRERRREHVDNPLPSHRSWDETLQVISGSQLLIESAVEELRWVLGEVAPAYTLPDLNEPGPQRS